MAMTTLISPTATEPIPQRRGRWHDRVLPGGGRVWDFTIGATTEIHLSGEIDVYDRNALIDVFTAVALEPGVRFVHVAASDVDFIDLRILRLIAAFRGQLAHGGTELHLTGLRGAYATAWSHASGATSLPESPAWRRAAWLSSVTRAEDLVICPIDPPGSTPR